MLELTRILLPSALLLVGCAYSVPVAAGGKSEPSVSEVFADVIDSVVLIEVQGKGAALDDRGPVTMQGLGSGVLVSSDGLVVTAAHVIQTADHVTVHFGGGEFINATVLRSDVAADVALIKLDWVPESAQPAPLGDSDATNIGDRVLVVGAPLGLSHTLTVGYLSARRRPDDLVAGLWTTELFQTDAAINQGNSGGPMFNMRGEVIGVVSHIVSQSGGNEGLGFAVTMNATKALLMNPGAWWTGIGGFFLSGPLAEALNLPQPAGILVETVAARSPAEALGLRGGRFEATIAGQPMLIGGDVILAVQGVTITRGSREALLAELGKLGPGDALVVEVLRDGQRVTLTGTLPQP